MIKFIVPIALLIVVAIDVKVLESLVRQKPRFEYERKAFIMTNAERECYDALVAEMGVDYYFFPQIHLDALVSPRRGGKSRLYAFRHINQKSVDFVACGKKGIQPLFVIELDDETHNQPQRVARDREVERILRGAGMPLIRIENRGRFVPRELGRLVQRGIDAFAATPMP